MCGRPHECKHFFGTIGHVIRCGRVSGLEVAAFHAPRACMEICRSGPIRLPALNGASSGTMVLPIRSLDRLPLRSSVLLTSAATHRRFRPMRPPSPDLCNLHLCVLAPKQFGPCGWPALRRPASSAYAPASARATTPRAHLSGQPTEPPQRPR